MPNHPDHPDWYEVRFHPQAIEDFGLAFPKLPPGDEVVLWIQLQPCSDCGKEAGDGEFGAIDPEYITDEGLLVGRQLCEDCLRGAADEETPTAEEIVERAQEIRSRYED